MEQVCHTNTAIFRCACHRNTNFYLYLSNASCISFFVEFTCASDLAKNNVVPIAVGAALAGLLLIVIVAYFIGRRNARAGYESV